MRISDFDPAAVRARRDQTLIRLLFRATNAMTAELTRRLQARGWTRFQPSFPRLLSQMDTEGTSISRLAERLGTSRQAISQLARSVEEAGLIERVPHPTDGRSVVLRSTRDGRRLSIAVLEVLDEMEAEYAALIGKTRLAELKQLLDALLEQIDPGGKLERR